MASLVSIPEQPGYKLTPDTLALLKKAEGIAGHTIPVDDAWRPYVEQKSWWDAYQNFLHGGPKANIASNPDDPNAQNNHMRGAAVDIVNRADRAAMIAAGFTPDGVEWWHFNNPNWRNMPIITADTSAAVLTNNTIVSDEMAKRVNLRTTTDGKTQTADLYWYSEKRGLVRIGNPDHLKLLTRLEPVLNSGKSDMFYPAEVKLFNDFYI